MRALIQRVSRASVTAGPHVAAIGPGLLVLLGVRRGDTVDDAAWTARKCAGLRVFGDEAGKMNRSLLDTGGEALVVSQFTLYGDADRGRRPSFTEAALPEAAVPLYEAFVDALRDAGVRRVDTGVFQAMMSVELVNDGPVTILVESRAAADVGPAPGGAVAAAGAPPHGAHGAARLGRLVYPGGEPLVLASASPRRTELLARSGIPHITAPIDFHERMDPDVPPALLAEQLARHKADAAAPAWPGRYLLAADTIVDLDGRSLGKPVDDADARDMLTALAGRSHRVHTGLALVTPDGRRVGGVETTTVTFRGLSPDEIRAYVESGEPRDKAGAYGIQGLGGLLVDRIDGSYDNVMGLPLNRLVRLVREAGEP